MTKKLLAVLIGLMMSVACFGSNAFAAEATTLHLEADNTSPNVFKADPRFRVNSRDFHWY